MALNGAGSWDEGKSWPIDPLAPLMVTVSSCQRGSLPPTSWVTFGEFLASLSLDFSSNFLNDKMELGIIGDARSRTSIALSLAHSRYTHWFLFFFLLQPGDFYLLVKFTSRFRHIRQ